MVKTVKVVLLDEPTDVVEGTSFLEQLIKGKHAQLAVTCVARISNASLTYGYEYQGIGRRLIRTQLTDRVTRFASSLKWRLGGNPVGPAGTGKTESVRALGALCGRHVVVFNCDEAFDLHGDRTVAEGSLQNRSVGLFRRVQPLGRRALSAVARQHRIYPGLL